MQSFSELSLSAPILRAVQEMGFETPSPIQQQALPILLGEATDFLGLAGTGTGKTAAFAIPLLERLDAKKKSVQSLILCPTRELAMQVAGQIDLLGKYKGIRSVTVYGGAPYPDQVRGIRSGAQIVVGTPGRVIDHLERKTLDLSGVSVLVLDEADEMFSMGFKEELDMILKGVNRDASNTWLFSATMSREVRRTCEENLRSPKTVQVNRTAMLATGVEQYFYRSQENEKPEMICKLIEAADDFYGLIFCQTKALVADLTRFMLDRGYKVDCLHGDMDQNSRERTMQAFRDKKLQVLICTDVAARGLDVKDITHVVNYSLPREMESYVHRIGRTARSGKTGIVMNLLTFSHRHLLGRIEQHTKVQMKEGFVPSKREIAAKKVARLLPTFADQPFASRVSEVMGEEFRAALAEMTPEDVATRFITMMMPDIFGGEESRKSKKASVARPAVAAPAAAPKAVVSKPVVAAAPVVSVSKPIVIEAVSEDVEPVAAIAKPAAKSYIASPAVVAADAFESESESESDSEVESEQVAAPAVEVKAEAQVDIFGDEVVEKKKSSIDQPPRARSRKPLLDEEEIASLLEEPPTFGVVKPSAPSAARPSRDSRPSASSGFERPTPRPSYGEGDSRPRFGRDDSRPRFAREDSRPSGRFSERPRYGRNDERPSYGRSDSRPSFGAGDSRPSFGSGSGSGDSRPSGRYSDGPRSNSQFRSSGPSRPGSSYGRSDSRPVGDRPASAGGFERSERPAGASRPEGSVARPPRNRVYEARPAAPANFAKPPKHEAGPARTERAGETGGLNRRARRAALFGRPVDGATPETSSN